MEMENQATIGRCPEYQILLRSEEEPRQHGVGGAIRGGRRSVAHYPQTGDFITNVSMRPGDEVVFSAARSAPYYSLRMSRFRFSEFSQNVCARVRFSFGDCRNFSLAAWLKKQ